jgi:hypothetical protein
MYFFAELKDLWRAVASWLFLFIALGFAFFLLPLDDSAAVRAFTI